VGMGIFPALLGHLSESTTTAMARVPAILQALTSRGAG